MDQDDDRLFVRPDQHEVDSMARGLVASLIPRGWEHRETTGRDYGIDMQVEVFNKGRTTGRHLMLQIKGTETEIDLDCENISFDIKVKTVLSSELFLAPVVLVLCPVNAEPRRFYFLWLQEYIRVVLDQENPNWRDNKASVRVKIPVHNVLPGAEDRLALMAAHANRAFAWAQLARIYQQSLSWYARMRAILDKLQESQDEQAVVQLQFACNKLTDLFNQLSQWSEHLKDDLSGVYDLVKRDVMMPIFVAFPVVIEQFKSGDFTARVELIDALGFVENGINAIITALAIDNDYAMRATILEVEGIHLF